MQNKLFTFLSAVFLFTCLNPTLTFAKSDLPLSIDEELRWIQVEATVFSAARREQKVSETSAAVFVLSQEDIRRSGVTSIPEALRLIPGFQVSRINSSNWAITSRGFNDRFTNKLLVLIDGRTIYTPLFAGIYWSFHNYMLEDIERIEAIRGPGSTLWGANAVNGVINIITKSAEDTQGGLISGGSGNEEKAFGALRYGGTIGDSTYFRGYVKYFDRDNYTWETGGNPEDDWQFLQGGFRIDGDINEKDSFTFQGDIYNGDQGEIQDVGLPFPPFSKRMKVRQDENKGGNVLARWKHVFSDTSDMALQVYYDRHDTTSSFEDDFNPVIDTYDIDFQHRFQLTDIQTLTWGLGYRLISDNIDNSSNLILSPDSRDVPIVSAFIQNEITIFPDRLSATLGVKFSYNYYSDFEIQPSARLLWTPHEHHSLWGAISRAVVTPSRARFDDDPFWGGPMPPGSVVPGLWALTRISGNKHFDSEELIAFEIGYRVQPMDKLSIDVTSFFNVYDQLQTIEIGTPFLEGSSTPPFLSIPATLDNKMRGDVWGVEVSVQWEAFEWWRLQAFYSYLDMNLRLDRDSTDVFSEGAEGNSPENQFILRSSIDLPKNVDWDVTARYVDELPNMDIDSYTEMDMRIGWKPLEQLELSIVGQNLLNSSHMEFQGTFFGIPNTEVERSVYVKVQFEF